jgi:hypothetical protein
VLTGENASFEGEELVAMRHPLKRTIKYIHNRFERIPRGKRIWVASLGHAEVNTESFFSLYNIFRGSVTLDNCVTCVTNLDFRHPHAEDIH